MVFVSISAYVVGSGGQKKEWGSLGLGLGQEASLIFKKKHCFIHSCLSLFHAHPMG